MEPTPSVAPVSTSSFLTRAANVFAAPGELYTEVAAAPVRTSSWLLPYVASILLGLVSVYAIYNNAALRQQVYDIQLQAMQKSVDQGKMTQDQLDKIKDGMESSGPAMFMLFGGLNIVVILSVLFFGVSLILWLIMKFALKAPGGYGKVLEMYGLAGLIGFFGGIVTLLLMNYFDSMHATPGAGLLILNSFDQTKFIHNVLGSLNVFSLWEYAVVGIGISKLSNKSAGVGMGIAFGLWAAGVVLFSALGWAR
jgi:hypothetical protein